MSIRMLSRAAGRSGGQVGSPPCLYPRAELTESDKAPHLHSMCAELMEFCLKGVLQARGMLLLLAWDFYRAEASRTRHTLVGEC